MNSFVFTTSLIAGLVLNQLRPRTRSFIERVADLCLVVIWAVLWAVAMPVDADIKAALLLSIGTPSAGLLTEWAGILVKRWAVSREPISQQALERAQDEGVI